MNSAEIEEHWALAKRGMREQDFPMVQEGCLAVLRVNPDHARAHNLLGLARIALGDPGKGSEHLHRSTQLEPGNAALWLNSGAGLLQMGDVEAAYAAYRAAEQRHAHFPARIGQANCLIELCRFQEALAVCEGIPASSPLFPTGQRLKAAVLCELGRGAEAHRLLRPFAWGESTLDDVRLFSMHYDPTCGPEAIRAAHEAWGSLFPRNSAPPILDPRADRILNIGFVSPDFRSHSCAHFLAALWAQRDPSRVRFFAYSEVPVEDDRTKAFRVGADGWQPTYALSDLAVAERVRSDRIDILVDLAGHTRGNRLRVFTHRPAPIQLTWLGYPGTTGLGVFDGRLTDALADPPDQDAHSTEPLLRLPHFLCYTPGPDTPEPGTPPSVRGEAPTFGCFNAPAKLNERVLDLWSRLLQQVPAARLLLKGKSFHEPSAPNHFRQEFESRGVRGDRIDFLGWVPPGQSPLSSYHLLDVALDPFPYNGTTTTCEALWMGVPVVTLAGNRHAGRVGHSLLAAAGLENWVAHNEDEYLGIAQSLVSDRAALASIRHGLRPQLAASPLMDGPAFSRSMEGLFRSLWIQAVQRVGSR